MYEISIEEEFSGAHRLRNYKGKCENLHGHNWKVQVVISGEKLDKDGLLMDFHFLKKKLRQVLENLDHTYLNNVSFFKKENPTSENISYYIYKKLKILLKNSPVKVEKVSVWENNRQSAAYYEKSK